MLPTSTTAFALACKNFPKFEFLILTLSSRRCLSNACDDEPEKVPKNRIEIKNEKFQPKKANDYTWKSIWENPKCCANDCEIYRHDLLFLKQTPKIYTRTWTDCEFWEKTKYVCDGEIEPPEIEHRTFEHVKEEANMRCPYCKGDEEKLGLIKCMKPPTLVGDCPKRKWPGCPDARDPPKCDKVISHKCCQKRCTQYPSYSECKRPKPKAPRAVECFCLRPPSLCEVYEVYRKFLIK